jgi:hypothetical protein
VGKAKINLLLRQFYGILLLSVPRLVEQKGPKAKKSCAIFMCIAQHKTATLRTVKSDSFKVSTFFMFF